MNNLNKSAHPLFVSSEWLNEYIHDPDIRIIDATWYIPSTNKNAEREYEHAHIPGAVFFDLDLISDNKTLLPHMLPTPENFALHIQNLGITEKCHIVIYDQIGLFSSPRIWWTFKVFGINNVSLLSGGFPLWKQRGYSLEQGKIKKMPSQPCPVQFNNSMVADWKMIAGVTSTRLMNIVDARGAERFSGKAPDIRPSVRAGHIPGSINLPFE